MAENGALCSYARWHWILLRGSGNEQECFEARKSLKCRSQCTPSPFYVEKLQC